MKNIFFILLITLVSPTFASNKTYDLKMTLSINGKLVSSPQINVKEGQPGSITQKYKTEETFIEVTATEESSENTKGIFMKFTVGTIDINGQKTILGTPQIVTMENEKAEVSVGRDDGKDAYALSVIAQRKSL